MSASLTLWRQSGWWKPTWNGTCLIFFHDSKCKACTFMHTYAIFTQPSTYGCNELVGMQFPAIVKNAFTYAYGFRLLRLICIPVSTKILWNFTCLGRDSLVDRSEWSIFRGLQSSCRVLRLFVSKGRLLHYPERSVSALWSISLKFRTSISHYVVLVLLCSFY